MAAYWLNRLMVGTIGCPGNLQQQLGTLSLARSRARQATAFCLRSSIVTL